MLKSHLSLCLALGTLSVLLTACDGASSRNSSSVCYPSEHAQDSANCSCGGPCPENFICLEGKCESLCGDGVCEPVIGETCTTCIKDCGCEEGDCCIAEQCSVCPPVCGNGEKEFGEECDDGNRWNGDGCTHDCRFEPFCGDGACQALALENCANCPEDCGCGPDEQCDEFDEVCGPIPPVCGDGQQEGYEECDDGCAEGVPGLCEEGIDDGDGCSFLCLEEDICGNGTCDDKAGETCATCKVDCFCAPNECCQGQECVVCHECGDGKCEPDFDEDCASCLADCGCGCGEECVDADCEFVACEELQCGDDGCGGTCGLCGEGYACEDGVCAYQPYCGDELCDIDQGEDCSSCPQDCPCTACGEECIESVCTFTACEGVECGDDGCGGVCGYCPDNHECQEHICVYVPWCGDGECNTDLDENCATCPGDCPCEGCGKECVNNACKSTACDNKECGDDGCGAECGTCPEDEECVEGLCI